MLAAVEKYSTIGFCAGTSGCLISAVLHGNPMLLPVVVGGVVGMLTGGAYGLVRALRSR